VSAPGVPENDTGKLRAGLRRVSWLAGWLVALVGLLTLVGWWVGAESLTTLLPGWPLQMTNTALLCLLGGGALVVIAAPDARPGLRVGATVAAGAVTLLAALTLVEYTTGVSLGIDRIVLPFNRPPDGRFPGRPSPQSATAFLFAGAALTFISSGLRGLQREGTAQVLALISLSIPVVALLGYAFGVPALYSVPKLHPHTGMSLLTAASLLVLGAGVLGVRPEAGLVGVVTSQNAGGVVARRMLLGLLAFVPVAFLVIVGERLDWYGEPVVSALLVFFALIEGVTFIVLTAARLDADDLARKNAEARLRDSEQRFRELFEQASDGIFLANGEGRYSDVNGAGCRMLGLPREKIVGERVGSFLPPEDLGRLATSRRKLLGGASEVGEWTMRCGDGSWVPVEVSAKFLKDGRWLAFIRDITERRRNEEALRAAREADRRLRAELEEVTRAALTVSETVAELREPSISAVLQTFALQAQVLTGARYVAIGLGTDPEKPFETWVHLGTSGAEAAFRGLPGERSQLESLLGVPISYRGRQVGNIYLADKIGATEFSSQDQRMIEMLAARAAVAIETVKLYAGEAAQRVWLRSIIDQMPEGVMLLNESGGVEAMNRALLALSSAEEGAVDPWGNPAVLDMRTPDGRPISFDDYLVVRALTRGEVSTDEEHIVRLRDGRFVPVLVSAAPVRDQDGRVTGAVAVIRDITARKELERLREEWASIVAHDLRQPVGAISLTAESLARMHAGEVPEKERKAVERIRSASGRLNRMIEDLLDASRIEAKRLSLERRVLELSSLVDAVVEGHRGATVGFSIRVEVEPEQRVFVDPDRIHQVLGNLITNATKYGRPGTEIRIGSLDQGDFVELVVTNHGPGIPAEELPLLFNRFGRTSSARADRTPGLGLGLYISKGLVEAHGGRMWVDSLPGEATSFHFTVPRSPGGAEVGLGAGVHAPA
jgi:PAS domain S-box-containing protein